MKTPCRRFSLFSCTLAALFVGHLMSRATMAASQGTEGDAVPVSSDPNRVRWDLADRFRVVCDSTALSSRAAILTKDGRLDYGATERTISISVKLDILDAEKLVGVDVVNLGILAVQDENGQSVLYSKSLYGSQRQYQEVREGYVLEGSIPVKHLMPSGFSLLIRLDPNQTVPRSLSRVEAYIYALYAEGKIQADIPFGPPRDWVDAAPGLRIVVTKDTPPPPGPIELEARGSSSPSFYASPAAIYKFWTCVQSTTGRPVLGLEDTWLSSIPWSLGDYIVVKTSLYDHVRDRSTTLKEQRVMSDPWGDNGAICWGWAEQDYNAYDTIRHTIAVHPMEVEVPFVLASIPIPAYDRASNK